MHEIVDLMVLVGTTIDPDQIITTRMEKVIMSEITVIGITVKPTITPTVVMAPHMEMMWCHNRKRHKERVARDLSFPCLWYMELI